MRKSSIVVLALVLMLLIGFFGTTFLLKNKLDEKMDLVLTYSNKFNYEPFIVAVEKGYFIDENLNITTMVVSGGIQSAEAIITGSADVGAMGDAPAIILLDRNPSARILCRYSGGEGLHRYIAQDYITQPKDLEGRKVGIQMGSSTHGSFLQWMKKNDVNMSKVTLVPMNPSDMPNAMNTKQIDAMAGSEPWPTNVERLCGGSVHQIGDSSGLGNTFPLLFMASGKALEEKPEAIKAAMRALQRAIDFINQNYNESVDICSRKIGLSIEDTRRSMQKQFFAIGFDDTDLQSLEQTAEFLLENGRISAIPEFTSRLSPNICLNDKPRNSIIMEGVILSKDERDS
ncbi:MAG: ABC transporter substrate-binding protein [Methanomassiliicoccales archaeon]